ncbi:MAG: LamG domain-containing protein [Armatimonadetes bacterium]|nr:LamG domain-containing protein [Armatimonadota bacterium]
MKRMVYANLISGIVIGLFPGAVGGAIVLDVRFDEGSGTVVHDSSPLAQVGEMYNMSDGNWQPGKIGMCLSFDAPGQYVEFPHRAELAPTRVTVEARVRVTGGINYRAIIEKPGCYRLYVRPSSFHNLEAGAWINGIYTVVRGGQPINDRTWHHVAFTYDGQAMKLYLDGAEVGRTDAAGNLFQMESTLKISNVAGGTFQGGIDELKVWDEARTFTPIAPPSVQPKDTPFVTVNNAPFFPIGLYGVPTTLTDTEMQEIAQNGFNTLMSDRYLDGSGWVSFLNRAQQFGLKAVVTVYAQGGTNNPFGLDLNEASIWGGPVVNDPCARREHVKATINAVKNHPALLCYESFDEVSQYLVPLNGLLEGYCLARELDPNHMVWFNHPSSITTQQWMREYNVIADVISIDIYPIPASAAHAQLGDTTISSVGQYTDWTRQSVAYEKPVWMVLQAYQWHDPPDARFLTADELRFMTYNAVIHGANGVFFFNYHPKPTYPPSYNHVDVVFTPEFWVALKQMGSQLASLSPTIMAQNANSAVALNNHTSEIEYIVRRRNGKLTVIAANHTPNAVSGVQFGLASGRNLGSVTVKFESRSITPFNSTFTDNFMGYAVHVYEFTEP